VDSSASHSSFIATLPSGLSKVGSQRVWEPSITYSSRFRLTVPTTSLLPCPLDLIGECGVLFAY